MSAPQYLNDVDGFILKNVLTERECEEWIAAAEAQRFFANGEQELFAGNRKRATIMDDGMSDLVWQKLKPYLQPREHDADAHWMYDFKGPGHARSGTYVPYRVSDLLRFSKYSPGGCFWNHTDTTYVRDEDFVGMLTVLVYLNEGYEGGETTIQERVNERQKHVVKPEAGMAFVFHHKQVHAGSMVTSGTKYVARTEVVFKRVA
jgi:hypothetical protein